MEHYAETPDGLVLVANGFDPVLRWDGLASQMEPAGVSPPDDALTVSGSGAGPIVGTYYGYSRFVDKYGNVSDFSPISLVYEASGTTGTITGATNATPIVITSTAHGLPPGSTVKVEGVGGNTSANNTFTITVIDADSFSLDDSSGTAAYTGGGTWTSGVAQIDYSAVPVPTDPKVARRQILRNTDGQTDVFYVDIDTDDLSSTTFTSTLVDDDLSTNESVPFLDSTGLPFANSNAVPPTHLSVLAHMKDRMFAAVERQYRDGSVKVTSGSAVVTGIGTKWTTSFEGRFLYVVGASKSYQIDTVDETAQTLTLLDVYEDGTDDFAVYTIRSAPALRRIIRYSESSRPESWPEINGLEIQDTNDFLTGLLPMQGFLFILENKHIHRLTFQDNPDPLNGDGGIFESANRGCVNNNCWVLLDDGAFLLDEEGIHRFDGATSESVSDEIADVFSTSTGDAYYRINWDARENFHAALFAPDQVMRWFVSLDGSWRPRHAICYKYRDKRWWIERWPFPVSASVVGFIRGVPQLFLGAWDSKVLASGGHPLDGPDPSLPNLSGQLSGSTYTKVTVSGASFSSSLVGFPLCIVSGRGKGQTRLISSVSGSTLSVGLPWTVLPDSTSYYQIGGIPYVANFSWKRFVVDEAETRRSIEIVFEPLSQGTFDLAVAFDFGKSKLDYDFDKTDEGVTITKGDDFAVCDLTRTAGVIHHDFSGHKEDVLDGRRFARIEISGVGGEETARFYELTFDGVMGRD